MYNDDTFDVADALATQRRILCIPMNSTRIIAFLSQLVDSDDWVDVLHIDGTYTRNIQRIQ
jgi:hypothetical protein